jgi:hypothetical protein
MSAATPDHADLLKRLERLERQRLVLLFVSVMALAAAGACVYMVRQDRQAGDGGTVEATRIVFRDATGRPRDSIRLNESGTGITFCDANGVQRAHLFTTADGATAWHLLAEGGAPRVQMLATKDGGGTVGVLDQRLHPVIFMGTVANNPTLMVSDENNKTLVLLDRVGLFLYDKDGLTKRGSFIRTDVGAGLGIFDGNARPRIGMAMTQFGPSLYITAENGALVYSRP